MYQQQIGITGNTLPPPPKQTAIGEIRARLMNMNELASHTLNENAAFWARLQSEPSAARPEEKRDVGYAGIRGVGDELALLENQLNQLMGYAQRLSEIA